MIVDPEKIPDTAVPYVRVGNPGRCDIEITSRYGKTHELVTMAVAVLKMPDETRRHLRTVWCDSKGCAFYTLTCSIWPDRNRGLIETLARDFAEHLPGYNGVYAEDATAGFSADLGPEWHEDFDDWGKGNA